MSVTIKTNNHERDLIPLCDLTEEERNEYCQGDVWMDSDQTLYGDSTFFRYKGRVYCTDEFMFNTSDYFEGWDGILNDTFFSGILIKYTEDFDGVIVGRFCA